jgi:hypothetical protein
MAFADINQQWVRPETICEALDLHVNTLRRLRRNGTLKKGQDFFVVSSTCVRYNLPSVLKALGVVETQGG